MRIFVFVIAVMVLAVFNSGTEPFSSLSGKHTIGEEFEGGIIFYLDSTGEHGLIAAKEDQKKSKWYNGKFVETGATGSGIGAGKQNTAVIVKAQATGEYAASICEGLVLNGYDDWFLPSKDELRLLKEKKTIVGGFNGIFYWCSTEYNSHYAWAQNFNNGLQNYGNKNSAPSVRAIRAF